MKSLAIGGVLLTALTAFAPALVAQQPATADRVVTEVGKQPAAARVVALQALNYADRYIRHANFLAELTPVANPQDRLDSTFRLVPGLAGGGSVSFEAVNYPGYYLRHEGFRVRLVQNNHSAQFAQDASFRMMPGLANPTMQSFQAVNYPDRYIRHRDFHVYLEGGADDLFRRDATFSLQPR
jgi:hypothetical protein